MFSETECFWFVFSSTQGIANYHLSSLGVYKRMNCARDDKIIFHNEESGYYLFRLNEQNGNWMVSHFEIYSTEINQK